MDGITDRRDRDWLVTVRLVSAILLLSWGVRAQVGEEVTFRSEDGLLVSAYWSGAEAVQADGAGAAPTVLLFHMARSSARGEYAETVQRLNASGYNTLAVDLRSGGDRLGAPNQTALRFGDAAIGYCDVYPDLVAALDWAHSHSQTGKLFAFGSSFSAGLVVKLAAEQGSRLAGAIAFSPASGGPMANCRPESYLDNLTVPLMAFRPDREMAIESVQAQAVAFQEQGVRYQVIENGQHGSLMLRPSQTGTEMEHAWRPVMEFLDALSKAEELSTVLEVDGWQLKADLLLPHPSGATPAVLLLHGAAGERNIYPALVAELASRGIASFRIDLRAHGESTNQGTFQPPWPDHTYLLEGTDNDIAAALAFLRAHEKTDASRIGVLSASYSGEHAVVAARKVGFDKAHVQLSPGSISDESIAEVDPSGKAWLFVRAEIERPFFDDIFAEIERSSSAEIMVLPGEGHADDLPEKHPVLVRKLGEWFERKLK